MNLLVIFNIIGFISVGIAIFAICFELSKNSRKKNDASSLIPIFSGCTPHEIAVQMMDFVCKGHFLKHIIVNDAPPSDDFTYTAMYKAYMRNSSVITYIKNVKGQDDYE